MSRKRFRVIDGEPVALAAVCVDCGSSAVYGLDRCHAHYMAEYRRRRAERARLESPNKVAEMPESPNNGKSPKSPTKGQKPVTYPKAPVYPKALSDFEKHSKARAVALYLREL